MEWGVVIDSEVEVLFDDDAIDDDDTTYEASDEDVTHILIARLGSRDDVRWSEVRGQDEAFFGRKGSFRDKVLEDEFRVLAHKTTLGYLFLLQLWDVSPGYQTVLEQREHWVAAQESFVKPATSRDAFCLRRAHSCPKF